MANILLINEKRSKMDLSAVKDAEGKMIILQPKGTTGSSRECHEAVLEHPHVEAMIKVKWLRYTPVSLTTPVNEPAAPPAAPPTPVETAPPAETSTTPVETVLPVETSTTLAETEAPAAEAPADEHTPPGESVDVGEAVSSNVSSSDKRKHRRDR